MGCKVTSSTTGDRLAGVAGSGTWYMLYAVRVDCGYAASGQCGFGACAACRAVSFHFLFVVAIAT